MIVRTCNTNMLAKYLILICLNTHYVIGDIITHHKHAKPLAYELYSAKDTENETIVSLELKSKYEENFDSTFENKIFEKIRTKLEAKINNTFDELFSCCKVPPTVTTESNRTEVVKNDTSLYCVVLKGEPEPNIKWQFGNISIESSFDRYNLLPNGSLKITNLKLSDSGNYACIGENTYGSSKSNITLNVNESPQVKTKSEMSKLKNEHVTLQCIVLAGTPPPKISWRFGNLKIDSDFSRYHLLADGSLKITYLRIADSGKYTCIAENVVAAAQANVKLNVNALPQVKTGPGITETEKNNVTLHCYIRAGKPMPRIKWRFGSRYIYSDFNRYYLMPNGSLKIYDINPTDSGDYICIGRNSVGRDQDTLTLNVTQPPKVKTGPEITETEKNNVTLHCDILAGIPMPMIKWRFGSLDIDSNFDRYRLMPNGSLEISNINITDSGDYICIAENFVGTAQDTLFLNVTQPPKVNTVPEITETEKNNVTLHCDILAGIPMPIIKWRFGSLDINSNFDRYHLMPNGSLEISYIDPTDSGDYICIAENFVGTAQDTLTLNVTQPPKVKTGPEITETEKNNVTLHCDILAGIPMPMIKWRFGSLNIDSDFDRYHLMRNGSLEISNINITDSGDYICIAKNFVGTAQDTLTLNVTQPPKVNTVPEITETEKNNVTLHCDILAGIPMPKIKWRFGTLDIDSDFDRYHLMRNGSLEISNITPTDSGDYICIAKNYVGTAQDTLTLNVTPLNIPPKIQSKGDVTELETRTATLKCTSSGVPPPAITWKFQNMVMASDGYHYTLLPDDSLQITNLQLSDSGVYSCIAQNVLGSVEAKVNLNVNELQIPPQLLKAEENISEMENSKITMRCEFSGKPKPKVTWSVGGSSIDRDFDRYRLLPDGALMITFLYRNDSGAYTCLAQNPVGTAQTTINLKVEWNNDWCPTTSATAYTMGATAVVVGKGLCGVHDLWVIRSAHGTGLIPGKYDVHTTVGSYAMDGVEHTSSVFEIFCSPDKVVWVWNTNGIPKNAILGGFTKTGPSGEPLYIGRAVQGSYLTSGMIWNNVLYIPYLGLAYQHTSFEVLCRA